MKKKYALLLLAVLPAVSHAGFNTYNVFSDIDGIIQFFDSTGVTKLDGSYTFELGVISGSDFSASSIATNFTSLDFSTSWDPEILGPDSGGFSINASYDGDVGYPNGLVSGQQIYIWGYNSKAIAPTSEWVVITNTSWVLTPPNLNPGAVGVDYTIADAGTTYVFGSKNSNDVILAAVGAIPEPSTFGLLFGLSALGMVACRRGKRA